MASNNNTSSSIQTAKDYDQKFFQHFTEALPSKAVVVGNNNDTALRNPNEEKSIALASALTKCQQDLLSSSMSSANETTTNTTPELFTYRRNESRNNKKSLLDNKTRSSSLFYQLNIPAASEWTSEYLSGLKPVRIIGFVQELDTETSLLDADPKRFVENIVRHEDPSCDEPQQEKQDQKSQQQMFVECSSAFVTPIPGFSYEVLPSSSSSVADDDDENNNNMQQQRVEEESSATTTSNKRNRVLSSPIQKRERNIEVDQKASDKSSSITQKKKSRVEQEQEMNENSDNNDNNHRDNNNTKTKKGGKVASLAYGDEDAIHKNEKDNIEDRKLWKDVLGLSVSPTDASLATGVIALLPHFNHHQAQQPQLFNLVELVGFLIPSSSDEQQEKDQHHQDYYGQEEYDDENGSGPGSMTSRFQNMPDSVCPRFLAVGWRILDSVEQAQDELKRSMLSASTPSASSNDEQQQQQIERETSKNEEANDEKYFQSLVELIESRLFVNRCLSGAAAKSLLLHLVSSVTIRNESGAFGDLPLGFDVVVSSDENNGNREADKATNSISSSSSSATTAFQSFVSQLSEVVRTLRPCSTTCKVDYQFDLLLKKNTKTDVDENSAQQEQEQHLLSLTHPSSVIARLDYEQQAVSSCLFSLPRGAEMILAVDDVENQFIVSKGNNNNNKIQQSVFAPIINSSSSSSSTTTLTKQEALHLKRQQTAVSSYSRNVNVISDLIINQKLPLLFGPQCEVSIERDIGMLFVIRNRRDNNNNSSHQQASNNNNSNNNDHNNRPLNEDAAASATVARLKQMAVGHDDEALRETCFGSDIFLPLRCEIELKPSTENEEASSSENNTNNNMSKLLTAGEFDKYFSRSRSLYRSCGTVSSNSNNNNDNDSSSSAASTPHQYFEDSSEGDKYFMCVLKQLRDQHQNDNIWWSTSMIKHSVANVLLTMARARACLGGRKLVRNSDIDEVRELLVSIRTKQRAV